MTPINSADRKRILILAIGLFFLFSLLIAQFFRIQIIEEAHWNKEAKKQHFFTIKEPFVRGTFYSNTTIRKGHPEIPQRFVIEVEKFHLYIDPQSIPKRHTKAIAAYLLTKLDLSIDEQLLFRKQFYRKSRSRKLAMWLDHQTRDLIMDWWLPFAKKEKIPRNALFFVSDYQRSYPFGKLLGQVLHAVQDIKDEKTGQSIPTGGLELYFNRYLQGKPGKRLLMRSPRNEFETGEIIAYPENGADIYLTINHHLQAIAEEEVAKGVKKSKAKAGWAVMIEPYTGEILALAQYPFFYPPDYQDYFNNKELIEHTRLKAILDANEPGSIMKPFTIAVALKANEELRKRGEKPIFSPTDKIATSNGRFPGRSKLLPDTHLHYFLNLNMAIQKSSNIYVARLVEAIVARLGKDWYRAALQDSFGFGLKTNIELPAESIGILPLPGKKHANGTFEWSASTPYSLAMGHNVQTTSLQMARACCVFVNGGYLVQPTLVRKIVKTQADGSIKVLLDNTTAERRAKFPKVMNDAMTSLIVNGMKYTTKTGGTGTRASIWGYTEGGKSGTANKVISGGYSPTLFCSSFVGFAPASKAAFVLLVAMDEPEYGYIPGVGKNHMGGTCSGPVFKEIATRALDYLGIPPDDPHGYPRGDPRYDPDKADWLPETRKLQEMYDSWNNGNKKASTH